MTACFMQAQQQAKAEALSDADDGLIGSRIARLFAICNITDVDPDATRRNQLCNALWQDQNWRRDRNRILGFIRYAMKPERFARYPGRFEPTRAHLNRALAFAGLVVDDTGTLNAMGQVQTLSLPATLGSKIR